MENISMNIFEYINETSLDQYEEIDKLDLQKISTASKDNAHELCLKLVEEAIKANFFDIRIVNLYLFSKIFKLDLSQWSEIIDSYSEMITKSFNKFTHLKNFNIHTDKSFSLFFKNVKGLIEYLINENKIKTIDLEKLEKSFNKFQLSIVDAFNIIDGGEIEKIISLLIPFASPKEEIVNAPEHKETEEVLDDVKNDTPVRLTENGSPKWLELKEKILVFVDAIRNGRILEASILFADINKKIKFFNPADYFPEVFFPFYEAMEKNFDKVLLSFNEQQKTLQWNILAKMYQTDYRKLLNKKDLFEKIGSQVGMKIEKDISTVVEEEGGFDKFFFSEEEAQ